MIGSQAKRLFSTIKSLGIIGAGEIGRGVAISVSTVAKIPVILYDSNEASLKNSQKVIDNWFKRENTKKNISLQEVRKCKENLKFVHDISAFKQIDVDFVVQAIAQDLNAKKSVFEIADQILKKSTIIASTTSSISITQLAKSTKRPGNVIGMHFFSPVWAKNKVKLIQGEETSE